MGVEPDAGEPLGQKARILTRRHASPFASTLEEKLARFFARYSDVVIDGLSRLLRQLKSDGVASLSLAHSGTMDGIAVGRDIVHLESDNITSSELAVDRDIEQR